MFSPIKQNETTSYGNNLQLEFQENGKGEHVLLLSVSKENISKIVHQIRVYFDDYQIFPAPFTYAIGKDGLIFTGELSSATEVLKNLVVITDATFEQASRVLDEAQMQKIKILS